MNKITLTRIRSEDNHTVGILEAVGEKFYTLEKPWKENEQNVSCVPAGFYEFGPFDGNKYKKVWEIKDVPDRSFILLHAGNIVEHTQGCVLVGLGLHTDTKGTSVVESKAAIERLRELMFNESGVIEIKYL